jgi:EAL and modified HD-GYP domain-containing signal transduction protein
MAQRIRFPLPAALQQPNINRMASVDRARWANDDPGEHGGAGAPAPRSALVARQPLFDSQLNVAAYDLLFRGEAGDAAGPVGTAAQVVAAATLDIGLRRLAGEVPVHIAFPAAMFTAEFALPSGPERIVVEVKDPPASPYLLEELMRLRTEGYRIALRDYDRRRDGVEVLDYVDIVRLDLKRLSPSKLATEVRALRKSRVELVAGGVDTAADLARCRKLDFELIQGDFLQQPETFARPSAPSSRLAALDLIQTLQDDRVAAQQIESRIVRDAGLSYRLLHCINASYYRTPRAVGSMLHAVLLLGYEELRRICSVLLLTSLNDRPAYVAIQSLARARMCEKLCVSARLPGAGSYFMTGLLSQVDALLGAPLHECLHDLPLNDAVRDALLEQRGTMGEALRCVLSFESGDWDGVRFQALPAPTIAAAYEQATEWADGVHAALTSSLGPR